MTSPMPCPLPQVGHGGAAPKSLERKNWLCPHQQQLSGEQALHLSQTA